MALDGKNRPKHSSTRRPRGRRGQLEVVTEEPRSRRRPERSRSSSSSTTERNSASRSSRRDRRNQATSAQQPATSQRRQRKSQGLGLANKSSAAKKTSAKKAPSRSNSSQLGQTSPRPRGQSRRAQRRAMLRGPHQLPHTAASKATVPSRASSTPAATTPATGSTATRRRRARRKGQPGSYAATWKQRQQQQQPLPKTPVSPLTYLLNLLIGGIGIGVIAGTVLSSLDPSLRYNSSEASAASAVEEVQPPSTELELTREMPALANQLQSLIAQEAELTAGVMVVDLDRKSYVDLNASRRFISASTIKLPILVALLEDVDAGKVSLDEMLTMDVEDIVGEAGEMQFQPPGTQFSVVDTATEMIRISDNTATNLLVERLGGMASLSARFSGWGLKQTQVQALLPDLEGLNTISPKDLVTLLGRLDRGDILSVAGRDRLFQILRTTQTNDLLPQGIGPDADIAHKTGNIGKSIGDVGLITMPSGKRYLMMAMVERPHGDPRADELIRNLAWETYQFLESTEQKSEQLVPPNIPRANIAGSETEPDASMMTTDP